MDTEKQKILSILETVYDPEVPVLSILDLGIVRSVETAKNPIEIVITPTYSGCPAMDTIRMNIRLRLIEHGYRDIIITNTLSPAWTTDWMTEKGKEKLRSFGIAPPTTKQQTCETMLFHESESIQCPLCRSFNTRMISRFGSTACKAIYQCNECAEPFDYFKCH